MASRLVALPPVDGTGGGTVDGTVGGERAVRVFDPLHDRDDRPGLVSRLAAAGFDPNALTVWPVPAARAAAPGAAVPDTLAAPMQVGLKPPGGVRFNDNGGMSFEIVGAETVTESSHQLAAARHAQLAGGRAGLREAVGLLGEALSPETLGSLVSPQPLPPVTEREIREQRAAEIQEGAAPGAGANARSRDERAADTTVRAAAAKGLVPWPADRALPAEVQQLHSAAEFDAKFFLAEALLDRGQVGPAVDLLRQLIFGEPNARAPAAASRLVKLAGDARNPDALRLAVQVAGGPDGPRLKVWLTRWTAPRPTPPASNLPADGAGASKGTASAEPGVIEEVMPANPDAAAAGSSEEPTDESTAEPAPAGNESDTPE